MSKVILHFTSFLDAADRTRFVSKRHREQKHVNDVRNNHVK